MREELCNAFCNEISVKEVPAGLSVSTAFRRTDGDPIEFYIAKGPATGLARLEDDGKTVPYLEACGVDFETQTRAKAFETLLIEYGAEYDSAEAVIHTPFMRDAEVPRAAIRFVALLLRLSDFLLLTQEHVESTFKEDATKRIKDAIGARAVVSEGEAVSERLKEVTPDLVIRPPNRAPVAIFLGQSPQRVYEAIFLQMAALYEARMDVAVVALLEEESSISREMRQRAMNRLAAVPVYRGDEDAAIHRIEREVIGTSATIH